MNSVGERSDIASGPTTLQNPSTETSTQAFTCEGYANAVLQFSRLPTGAGQNHERLADFLFGLRGSGTPPQRYGTEAQFLTVYEFKPSSSPTATLHVPQNRSPRIASQKWDLGDAKHFSSCQRYAEHDTPSKEDSPGNILFMRGNPTPQWLGLIGSTHRVDPEMFSRWLNFRHADDWSNNFSFPSLPSNGWNLIELPIVTIGSRNSIREFTNQNQLDAARRESATALRGYHNRLSSDYGTSIGTSAIRNVCLFDDVHFALEQKIAICLQPQEGSRGYVLLVWMDAGDDLANSLLSGPWKFIADDLKPNKCFLSPIIRYRPSMGLQAHLLSRGEPESTVETLPSAASLHLNYGRTLRTSVMASDPFYALNEVFTLASASHKQFLNLVEHKLNQYTDLDDGNFDALPNLRYLKQILLRHIQQIHGARLSIQCAKQPKWPKAEGDVGGRARAAIEQEYAHLYDHAQTLNTRCQEAITVLMTSISILESKKGIMQAERVGKLTFLAFIFAPLSFTTSFLSMQVNELQGLSIWVWFAMSTPIFIITYTLFSCDVVGYWQLGVKHGREKIDFYVRKLL